jgi:hypothetical protein
MARQMREGGIDCGKVWNYAPGYPDHFPDPPLKVDTPNAPFNPNHPDQRHVTWGYHVAPVVNVQQPDGTSQLEVIDPSMFDHPVPVEQWRAAQHCPDATTKYTDPSPYYWNGKPDSAPELDPDNSKTATKLTEHRNARDTQPDQDLARRLADERRRKFGP